MPRVPKGPRYFPSRRAYFVQWGGKQRLLAAGPDDQNEILDGKPGGPTYRAALAKYAEIMAVNRLDAAKDENEVVVILDQYLQWVQRHRKPATFTQYKAFLESFVPHAGTLRVKNLTPAVVDRWCAAMEAVRFSDKRWGKGKKRRLQWSREGRRNAIKILKTALNWGVKHGLITRNPITHMEKPRARSRGKEAVITDEEHRKVMGLASPALGELLTGLLETGARPGELCKVTAAELKCAQGVWVLDLAAWKTERYGGSRVILLGGLAELVRRLAERHPSGPLFRTPNGKPWTEYNLDGTFRRLRRKLGLRSSLVPYSYRHRFATRWLVAGGSIAVLSQLLGSSVRTLQEHYAHLTTDTPALYRQLMAVSGSSVCSLAPGEPPLAEAS